MAIVHTTANKYPWSVVAPHLGSGPLMMVKFILLSDMAPELFK